MYLNRLKRIRLGVSLLFFTLTMLLFLDFRNIIAPLFGSSITYLQFVPSLMKFLNDAVLTAAGFLVVLLVTVVMGRIYCSTVCPLGMLQDIAAFVLRKRNGRNGYKYRSPNNIFRYLLLCLTALLFLAGSGLLLNLLDPFSGFGRIIANILRPLAIVLNNGVAMVLELYGNYFLVREQWAEVAPLSTGVAAAMLVLVLWFAVSYGRLYCNTLCPVGALLGLVANFSVLRIQVDKDFCSGCKRCETVCKAGCIDLLTQNVDMSRCIACYNCLAVCTTGGMRYTWRGHRHSATAIQPDRERREFLFNAGISLLGIAGLTEPGTTGNSVKTIIQSKPTTIPVVRTSPVSPPGSGSIAHFTANCTACHLCVSACPTQILLPSFMEYGLSGLMQPRMNFPTGHCTYECTICSSVCPAGAILPVTAEEKKLIQTGIAKFIKENCVVFTDNTACGACSEHCPTKAVNMVPYANKFNKPLGIPEVKADYCIGCGGCEHACPTKPYKAIFVDGNPLHKLAKKPVVQKIEQAIDYKEDFPF